MNRTDRLTGILLALRGGQRTAADLAERFEVSRRTILRDLAALGELGVPVVAVSGAGGGFSLPAGYWLPPLRLTEDEATALLLGLAALGPADGGPFGEPRRTAEEKIRAIVTPETLRGSDEALRHVAFDPGLAVPESRHVVALRDAVRAGRWLRVGYRSARRTAEHDLRPLRLVAAEGRWYVDAVSREARERRRYRIDRVDSVTPIPDPPGAAGLVAAALAAVPAGDRDDRDDPEVALRLTDAGLTRAPDVLGLRLDPVAAGDGWEVRLRPPASEIPFFARCVLLLGDDCRATGGPELLAAVRAIARTALERHPDPIPGAAPESVT